MISTSQLAAPPPKDTGRPDRRPRAPRRHTICAALLGLWLSLAISACGGAKQPAPEHSQTVDRSLPPIPAAVDVRSLAGRPLGDGSTCVFDAQPLVGEDGEANVDARCPDADGPRFIVASVSDYSTNIEVEAPSCKAEHPTPEYRAALHTKTVYDCTATAPGVQVSSEAPTLSLAEARYRAAVRIASAAH